MVRILSFENIIGKKFGNSLSTEDLKKDLEYLSNKDVSKFNIEDTDKCVKITVCLYFNKNRIKNDEEEFKSIFKSYLQLMSNLKDNNINVFNQIEYYFLNNLKGEYIRVREDETLATIFLNDTVVDLIMPDEVDIKKLLDNYNEYFNIKNSDRNTLYSVIDEFLERRKYEFLSDKNQESYVLQAIDAIPFLYYEQKQSLLSKFLSDNFILVRNKLNNLLSVKDETFKVYMAMNEKYKLGIDIDRALSTNDYSLLNNATANFVAIVDLDGLKKLKQSQEAEFTQRSPGSNMNWR